MSPELAALLMVPLLMFIAFDCGRWAGQRICRKRLREALALELDAGRKKRLEAVIMRPLPHMFRRDEPLIRPNPY